MNTLRNFATDLYGSLPGVKDGNTTDSSTWLQGHVFAIICGVAAAIALLMIVIGGMQYVLAKGNPQEVAKARDTIIYSAVGLLVITLAYALVSLVLTRIFGS